MWLTGGSKVALGFSACQLAVGRVFLLSGKCWTTGVASDCDQTSSSISFKTAGRSK